MLSWKEAVKEQKFIVTLIIVSILAFFSMYIIGIWLSYNETRISEPLVDPVLAMFAPIDLSILIAFTTNFGILVGLISVAILPLSVVRTMMCITLLALMRMTSMYLVPLEPPENIIPLRDYFIESIFYSGKVYTKDLFFSGHTSFLVLLCLLVPFKKIKWFLAITASVVGVMLVLQHVHYTIDVVIAPFFAILAYFISKKIFAKYIESKVIPRLT